MFLFVRFAWQHNNLTDRKGENMFVDNEKMDEEMHYVLPYLRSLVETIEAINTEDNPEVVAVYIETLEHAEAQISKVWGPKAPTKESIRKGTGDYAAIKDKCIAMGLV
jgi:hypothetical protein